jgi:2-methylisocitrate lyase-like PEP mutase family enzyme
VWTLRRDKYLAAVASRRPDDEIVRFLAARSHADLPAAVTAFFQDAAADAHKLRDLGPARVIECQDAALVANDRRLRKLSWRCGERHLIVPTAAEVQFRKGLHDLGYALPSPGQ